MKTVRALIILIVAGLILFFVLRYQSKPAPVENTPSATKAESAVTFKTEPITGEANFTGTRLIVSGPGIAAAEAQKFVDSTIADFKKNADQDVPAMKVEFGADSPTASYTIDFNGDYKKSATTESIIIGEYAYTGGANGMELYKTFNDSLSTNKIIDLSAIIKPSEQSAFTDYVKASLKAWQPDGSDAPVVFPEDVDTLTFTSFTDWSLDNKNLTLYFDKDDIAPGVVGAIAYPLPLASIEKYLTK